MNKTEYIVTGQVLRDFPTDSDSLREAADQADWTVCKTYEAAKYRAQQWRKEYKFVYVRECSTPINL
jgi:hypothetical protein